MEVLSRNIVHADELRLIHGIQLARGVKPITHLFFADDSVFFFKDKGDTVVHLVQLINDFCGASGQRLNVDKSGILFSPNTTLIRVQKILKAFNIKQNVGIGRYLGIPAEFKESKKECGWFRHPECAMSDKALLAKHGWRIVSGEVSLFCRIFRQKIFGTRTFKHGMNPIRGSGSSWGVRSIIHGLTTVMEHIGWKPGIDSNLNVWTARWVGGERPEPRTVWLDPDNGHLANLQDLFTNEWATRILAIPRCEDFMDKAGTVKDRSRLNTRGRMFCQKVLWKLPVPQMWKVLLWRTITNALPIGHEFAKRKIVVDASCGMCFGEPRSMETLEYLFRDCGLSSRIWASSDLGIRVEGARDIPISDWITDWILYLRKREEGPHQVIHFVAIIWCLWTMRNMLKFQDLTLNSNVIMNLIFKVVREKVHILCKSQDSSQYRVSGRTDEEVSTQKESMDIRNGHPVCVVGKPVGCDVTRVKVDASWNQTMEAAVGWIAYDELGQELGRRQVHLRAESPLQAEALGVRDVVEWAKARHILHLDISSDCLQLISQLAEVATENPRIVGVLQDIRESFSAFHCLCFNFIPRHLNGIAHSLAQQAMKM
ncbi:uncharacterized protein LOC141587947 [Silene latifolia]|uniref:uncharacterized protein LOC141587947 n=1 Tax=Silene latifolia TaxID=37657 RepID=UPI003D783C37